MARKQTEALQIAARWVGRSYPAGWCQKWVVAEVFASGGVGDWDGNGRASAIDGWKAARVKVATSNPHAIPAGVPIYWTGGKDGHAAVSAGNGHMYSTDLPSTGRVGLVPISDAARRWGYTLVGYVLVDGHGNDYRDPTPTHAAAAAAAKPLDPLGEPMLYICGTNNYVVYGHNGGWSAIAYTPNDPKSEFVSLKNRVGEPVWINAATLNHLIEDSRGNINSTLLAEVRQLAAAEAAEVKA